MVYVKKITVENYSEFLEMALHQKFTMAQDIVETVLENLNTNKIQQVLQKFLTMKIKRYDTRKINFHYVEANLVVRQSHKIFRCKEHNPRGLFDI